jgi:hypothetical protein
VYTHRHARHICIIFWLQADVIYKFGPFHLTNTSTAYIWGGPGGCLLCKREMLMYHQFQIDCGWPQRAPPSPHYAVDQARCQQINNTTNTTTPQRKMRVQSDGEIHGKCASHTLTWFRRMLVSLFHHDLELFSQHHKRSWGPHRSKFLPCFSHTMDSAMNLTLTLTAHMFGKATAKMPIRLYEPQSPKMTKKPD